jgi:hypothetical protein
MDHGGEHRQPFAVIFHGALGSSREAGGRRNVIAIAGHVGEAELPGSRRALDTHEHDEQQGRIGQHRQFGGHRGSPPTSAAPVPPRPYAI